MDGPKGVGITTLRFPPTTVPAGASKGTPGGARPATPAAFAPPEAEPTVVTEPGALPDGAPVRAVASLARPPGLRLASAVISSVVRLSCHSTTTFEVPIETNL
jgi:hypothetical protein